MMVQRAIMMALRQPNANSKWAEKAIFHKWTISSEKEHFFIDGFPNPLMTMVLYTTCTLANSTNQTSNLHKLLWLHINHIQEGLYGVYADVPFFRTWIDEQIAAKGGATFCS